jgi:hypothetical protein
VPKVVAGLGEACEEAVGWGKVPVEAAVSVEVASAEAATAVVATVAEATGAAMPEVVGPVEAAVATADLAKAVEAEAG